MVFLAPACRGRSRNSQHANGKSPSKIKTRGVSSTPLPLLKGVPQGSFLCPLLFSLMCRWYLRQPFQWETFFYLLLTLFRLTGSFTVHGASDQSDEMQTQEGFSLLLLSALCEAWKAPCAAASDPSGPRFHFHRSGMLLICQLQVSLFISRTEPTAFHGSWQITSVYSDCKTSIWGDIMDTRPLLALLLGLLTCELMVGANDGHMCFVHRKPLFLPQQPVCS